MHPMDDPISPQSSVQDVPLSIGLTTDEAWRWLRKVGPNAVPDTVDKSHVLGIAALTSSSAFAATKAPKTTPATHKVAQAAETKPAAAKADKKIKKDTKAATAGEKASAPAKK